MKPVRENIWRQILISTHEGIYGAKRQLRESDDRVVKTQKVIFNERLWTHKMPIQEKMESIRTKLK